jgi:hypothetical protein
MELATTETLDRSMAAAAKMGVRTPAIASEIPARL